MRMHQCSFYFSLYLFVVVDTLLICLKKRKVLYFKAHTNSRSLYLSGYFGGAHTFYFSLISHFIIFSTFKLIFPFTRVNIIISFFLFVCLVSQSFLSYLKKKISNKNVQSSKGPVLSQKLMTKSSPALIPTFQTSNHNSFGCFFQCWPISKQKACALFGIYIFPILGHLSFASLIKKMGI